MVEHVQYLVVLLAQNAMVKYVVIIVVTHVYQIKSARMHLVSSIFVRKVEYVEIVQAVLQVQIVKVAIGVRNLVPVLPVAQVMLNAHLGMYAMAEIVIVVIVRAIQIVLLGKFVQIIIAHLARKQANAL